MRARCVHGAPWFADCPWCKSENPNSPRLGEGQWPFWANVVRMDAKVRMVQALVNRALDSWDYGDKR